MQREQKLKSRAKAGFLEETSGGYGAVAYAAKQRGYSKGQGISNELGAIDAKARVVLGGRTAQIKTDNVVRMEVVKRGGLWDVETVGKQRAFLEGTGQEQPGVRRGKKAGKSGSMVKKTVKVVEIDRDDSDDVNGGVERKVVRANVGAATEAVGAEELEYGVEKTLTEKGDDCDIRGVWMTPMAKKTARKRSTTS
ncbi:hypothetical protein KFL_016060010 [Klebsormidium nitens]|uniref:Uncharacterized protein n=1 Tax=Klebsormidium nitens TaxID=105231 RepID=A0A1Y1IV70_KLENI|nr:hypothetical protein KFL_016060010 [Klebsormidium nitens]|eukprot:GAQ93519.1 hypothetical protein KFL_016060010 [Klebsormidium nitens]